MKKIILSLTLTILILFHIPADTPEDLVYMTEEYPPFNFEVNGELKGITIDILKLMWMEMGVKEQEIKLYPWARGYHNVQEYNNHVLFAMSRTEDREDLFKWVGPIFNVEIVLIGLSEQEYNISSLKDLDNYKIGTVIDDAVEQLLENKGVKDIEGTGKFELNFKKLMSGRIDLVAITKTGVKAYIERGVLEADKIKTVYKVGNALAHYAFNKNTSDKLIKQFQAALDILKKDGRADIIVKRYFEQ